MSTTAQRSPEPGEGSAPAGRPARVIPGEAVKEMAVKEMAVKEMAVRESAVREIPVRLFFRADPGGLAAASGAAPGTASGAAGVPLGATVVRPAVRPAEDGTAPGSHPDGAGPAVEEGLAECRAPVLPGAVGVLAGAVGAAGCVLALWWAGVLPGPVARFAGLPGRVGAGAGGTGEIAGARWVCLAGAVALALFGFGGLARGRTGRAWVLSLFGRYRGSVRHTGLLWVNPLLKRRPVDVRLRHWRSEPMPVVDRCGVALRVVVLVVWRVRDTARAALAVEDHQEYLRECVEATTARVLSGLPADAFHDDAPTPRDVPTPRDAPTLRDTAAVGAALTRALAAQTEPVGVEIFSVQPTRVEYAPEIAAAMHRRRVAALDARHRDGVLTAVVDSVEETLARLAARGLVEGDDYERKALVRDLTVAFCTGRRDDGA